MFSGRGLSDLGVEKLRFISAGLYESGSSFNYSSNSSDVVADVAASTSIEWVG